MIDTFPVLVTLLGNENKFQATFSFCFPIARWTEQGGPYICPLGHIYMYVYLYKMKLLHHFTQAIKQQGNLVTGFNRENRN